MFIFARVESRRMEAGARDSRIVVVSQSNRNCNHGLSFVLDQKGLINVVGALGTTVFGTPS